MIRTAILGPIAAAGEGVIAECLECGEAAAGLPSSFCPGFGPGCLGYKPRRFPATAAEDLAVELHAPKPG